MSIKLLPILLITLLKLTQKGPVDFKELVEKTCLPLVSVRKNLGQLIASNLIKITDDKIEVSSEQRISLAIDAIKIGVDPEAACRFLRWQEFEDVATIALEKNGYVAFKRFRFKLGDRRGEIDVLGFREPLILCIDCKHWKRTWQRGAMIKAIEAQFQRVKSLSNVDSPFWGKMKIGKWIEAYLVPVVLTLSEAPFNFYKRVPAVPIFRFGSFIQELPGNIDKVAIFHVEPRSIT